MKYHVAFFIVFLGIGHDVLAKSGLSLVNDLRYSLLDNNGDSLGNLQCIQGGGTCTSASNCGWDSPRSWAP